MNLFNEELEATFCTVKVPDSTGPCCCVEGNLHCMQHEMRSDAAGMMKESLFCLTPLLKVYLAALKTHAPVAPWLFC